MTYRVGYRNFFQAFRGQECIIVFNFSDPHEWWVAPMLENGDEGDAFTDLTVEEEETIGTLVWGVADEGSSDL